MGHQCSMCGASTLGIYREIGVADAGAAEHEWCLSCGQGCPKDVWAKIAALQSRIDRAWKRLEEWRSCRSVLGGMTYDAVTDAQAILKEE